MTTLGRAVQNLGRSGPVLREASASGNLRVVTSLLGPACRGLVMQVVDEGRHVEVDNLYTIVDALIQMVPCPP